MGHQHSLITSELKKKLRQTNGKSSLLRKPSEGMMPEAKEATTASTLVMLERLHQTIGNQAVQRMVMNNSLLRAQAEYTSPILQRQGDEEGEEASAGPAAKNKSKTSKAHIDQVKAVEVLQEAYKDYVKKIEGGTVEVLSQADFQAAYDKIYGSGQYSWDKYVKPTFGNLEGFAHAGVNYINNDMISVDVVPHEMLHNNTHSSWTPFAGSELNEGTTEYLTIKAVKAAKYKPTHSYSDQEDVVQNLVKVTSEDLLMKAYFKGETEALKTEMEAKCQGSWADFVTAMQEKKWKKAKAYLKPKKKK